MTFEWFWNHRGDYPGERMKDVSQEIWKLAQEDMRERAAVKIGIMCEEVSPNELSGIIRSLPIE